MKNARIIRNLLSYIFRATILHIYMLHSVLCLLVIAATCFGLRPWLSAGCGDGQELRARHVGAIINK
jgi:hypothetical protein